MQHLDEGRLQAWVDRERSGLEADEQDAIERHLEGCGACAGRVAGLVELDRHTRSLLSADVPPFEPPEFAEVVGKADSLSKGHRQRRRLRAAAWAASVTVALGVGWGANELVRGGTAASGDAVSPSTPAVERAARSVARTTSTPAVGPTAAEGPASGEPDRGGTVPVVVQEPAALVADATPARPSPPPGTDADPVERPEITLPAPTEPILPVAAPGAPPLADPVVAGVEVASIPPASPPRVVHGRVTDESGSPIMGAQVYVDGTSIGGLTNADGTFLLGLGEAASTVDTRPLALIVERIGYGRVSRDLSGGRGAETLAVDVRLAEQALSLDAIVVTGAVPGDRTDEGVAARERAGNAPGPVLVGAATWAPLQRASAEASAGFEIMSIGGRPTVAVSVESFEGVRVSRIEQTLEGGELVVLLQSRRAIRVADELLADGQRSASTTRDGFFVVAVGALSVDRLEAVLRRVR